MIRVKEKPVDLEILSGVRAPENEPAAIPLCPSGKDAFHRHSPSFEEKSILPTNPLTPQTIKRRKSTLPITAPEKEVDPCHEIWIDSRKRLAKKRQGLVRLAI